MSERNSPLAGSRESLTSIDPNVPSKPITNLQTARKTNTM